MSLTLAGTGSGSERAYQDEFRKDSQATAHEFETLGSAAVAQSYGHGPGRVPFEVKDPRGFAAFLAALAEHDAQG
jgi:3-oxoadipate enol-lactonase